MRLGIYTNKSKDNKMEIALKIVEIANSCGFECFCADELLGAKKTSGFDELLCKSEMLVIVGGDGTVLSVSAQVAKHDLPILPVNNGRMGFLSEIELPEIEEALKNIRDNHYTIEERMMMDICFKDETVFALNEIVVSREKRNSISNIDVYSDNVYFDTYEGDGVIVCTPTGSTGYSLSAGGPVLSPKVNALVLTPLCVHSLHNRPIVFNDDEVIKLQISSRDDENSVYIDGREIKRKFEKGAEISIGKSKLTMKFVRLSGQNFYDKMYKKLVQWNNLKK